MDIDAGVILEGKGLADVGSDIIDRIQHVIGGASTKAELNQKERYICLLTTGPVFVN
jgi:altronate dehydratase